MTTTTEENHLKAIYYLSKDCTKRVFTNDLADKIGSKPSSITDMVKKLSKKGLISYQKYKGVELTESGKVKSLKIIRKHRLWELFLVKHLKLGWDEVHDMAEQLEHIDSDTLINRLDAFMEYPSHCPHGDPIPDANGKMRLNEDVLLSKLRVGNMGLISCVNDDSSAFLQYLNKMNIELSSEIRIEKILTYDKSMQVRVNNSMDLITLSEKATNSIYIKLIS